MPSGARLLLFTGNGKGKTTAALGLSMRAAGHGMRVCFVQFVKSPDSSTGEAVFLERTPGIDLIRTGLGRVPPEGEADFPQHREAAQNGLSHASGCLRAGRHQVVVLDEICVAIDRGLIGIGQVCGLIRLAGENQIVVMTGRNAPQELIDAADTVTEMRSLKHAYDTGRTARKGVEM